MKPLFSIALMVLLLARPAWSDARLAIVAGEEARPVADLLTAELSKKPGVELVERDEIDKVMREHELSASGNLESQLNLTKLLRAQGLLMLEVTKGENGMPAVLHARLAAVEPGVVIFDMDAPLTKENAGTLSSLLSSRLVPLLPKLQVEKSKAVPVSILNVRAVDSKLAPMERGMTMLLASRLESEPSVFVMERRRLNLLANEKTIGEEPTGAFWNGAWLLDGSIEGDGKNDRNISVHLRLRKSGDNGKGRAVFAEGPAGSVKELVAKLASQVLEAVGRESSAPQWDPAIEAREYLDEAIWAKNQAQYPVALEAAESAAALGLNSPDVYFIRTWLYAHKAASAKDLEEADHSYIEAYRTPASLNDRYDAAMKAIELCEVYLDEKMYDKLSVFDLRTDLAPRNNKISQNVVRKSSEVLAELAAAGSDSPDMPREPLRQAIRKLARFNPAAGELPGDIDEIHDFARYWADSADELVSYYYLQMLSDDPWQKQVTAVHLYQLAGARERIFSDYPDPEGMFDQLLKKMLANPRTQMNAWFFMSGGKGPPKDREEAYGKFLDAFWNDRDAIMAENMFPNYVSLFAGFDQEMLSHFAAQHLRILRYYMAAQGPARDTFFKQLWKPQTFPQEQAADVWKEFLAYRQHWEADPKTRYSASWDVYTKQFTDVFPALKSAVPPPAEEAKTLLVTRFWQPYGIPGRSKMEFYPFITDQCWADGKFWLTDKFNGGDDTPLYAVDLDSFKTDSVPLPKNSTRPVVTNDAIYVEYFRREQEGQPGTAFIGRFDRKAATWEERRIPGGEFFMANGAIYLALSHFEGGEDLSSLARYDWASDKVVYLASSRRKPGLNQFDDCRGYLIRNVFEGPGHRVCANIDGGIYFVREDAGNWDALPLPSTHKRDYFRSVTSADGTLVYSIEKGEPVYYLDPAKRDPVAWVGGGGGATPWEATADYQQLVSRNTDDPAGLAPGGFYVLGKIGGANARYELRWYAAGAPRQGVAIPLQFQLDAGAAALLGTVREFAKIDPRSSDPSKPEAKAFPLTPISTGRGIVLLNIVGGFWFIPYSSIEDYLKQAKQNTPPMPANSGSRS